MGRTIPTVCLSIPLLQILSNSSLAPVHEVMKWERKFVDFEVNSTNPYKGQPSPELDAAWEALFTCKRPKRQDIPYLRSRIKSS